MGHGVGDGGGFIAAMHHALGALLVVAGAVPLPLGLLHEPLESGGVALTQKIAGPLPAEDVARGVTPRRTAILLVAGEEIEEKGGLADAGFPALAAPDDIAEQQLGLSAVEEMLLVRRPLVRIARRDGDALHPQRHGVVENLGHARRLGVVEQGAVDVHPETQLPRLAGRPGGDLEHAPLVDGVVVFRLQPIEMNGEGEIRAGLEKVELLLQKHRVGAEVDELLARHDARNDLADLLVDERLAAGDGDDGRAALVHRLQALLNAQALIQDFVRVVDLAAAGTGQIAT